MENLSQVMAMLSEVYNNLSIVSDAVLQLKESRVRNVNVKLLEPKSTIPTSGSEDAAGYDLYACLDGDTLEIQPHTTAKVSTGLAIELPSNTFGAIFARSGLATKKGLRPSNCTGVVDSDYRGTVIVALHNDTDEVQCISDGERIAQLVVLPYISVTFTQVDELSDTSRGDGGFGSSGDK